MKKILFFIVGLFVFFVPTVFAAGDYQVKSDGIYWGDRKLEGVDRDSFQVLNDMYARDKNTIISADILFPDIDINTFEVLSKDYLDYGRDKDYVYYDGFIINGADPNTFEIFSASLSKDNDQVFYITFLTLTGEAINGDLIGADAPTFKKINSSYAYDKNYFYYNSGFEGIKKMKKQGSGLTILSPLVVKDEVNAYVLLGSIEGIKLAPIDGINVENFKSFSNNYMHDTDGSIFETKTEDHYYTDGIKIFYIDQGLQVKQIVEADLQSFQPLSISYSKDKNNIYFGANVFSKPDYNSFTTLGDSYGKDKNNIYFGDEILDGFDLNSFSVIEGTLYTKDKNGIYFINKKMEGVDTNTFEVLGRSYFKDKNGVYFRRLSGENKKIEGADMGTFEVAKDNNSFARDKNNYYLNGVVTEDQRIIGIIKTVFEKDVIKNTTSIDSPVETIEGTVEEIEEEMNKVESMKEQTKQNYEGMQTEPIVEEKNNYLVLVSGILMIAVGLVILVSGVLYFVRVGKK